MPAPPGQQVRGLQIWPLKVAELRLNGQSGETTHPFPREGEGGLGGKDPSGPAGRKRVREQQPHACCPDHPPSPQQHITILTTPRGCSWDCWQRGHQQDERTSREGHFKRNGSPLSLIQPACSPPTLPATASRQKQDRRAATVSRPADPSPCRKCRLSTPPEPGPPGVSQGPGVMLPAGVAQMTSTWSPPAPSPDEVTLGYVFGMCPARSRHDVQASQVNSSAPPECSLGIIPFCR